MSHFSTALQQIVLIREPGHGGQRRFATQTGLEQASLSRYLSGDSTPDVHTVERICMALTEPDRAALVIAYLLDHLPPSGHAVVRIENALNHPSGAEVRAPIPAPLPRRLREAFEILHTQAAQNSRVAAAVIATAGLVRERPSRR